MAWRRAGQPDMDGWLAGFAPVPVVEVEREKPTKVPSLRAALKAGLSDEEVASMLELALREAVDAKKGAWLLCPGCKKKHQHEIPDWNARVAAWKFLLETTDGRTPQAASAAPLVAAGSFEEMSDDQLAALIDEESVPVGD